MSYLEIPSSLPIASSLRSARSIHTLHIEKRPIWDERVSGQFWTNGHRVIWGTGHYDVTGTDRHSSCERSTAHSFIDGQIGGVEKRLVNYWRTLDPTGSKKGTVVNNVYWNGQHLADRLLLKLIAFLLYTQFI